MAGYLARTKQARKLPNPLNDDVHTELVPAPAVTSMVSVPENVLPGDGIEYVPETSKRSAFATPQLSTIAHNAPASALLVSFIGSPLLSTSCRSRNERPAAQQRCQWRAFHFLDNRRTTTCVKYLKLRASDCVPRGGRSNVAPSPPAEKATIHR